MHEYFLQKLWIVHVKCKLVLKPAVPSSPPLLSRRSLCGRFDICVGFFVFVFLAAKMK